MLEVERAIEHLRGDDPRPLLILRDCQGCPNKEGDLLKRTLENERIMLASPWFHCVRVPHEVIEENHPLSALFQGNIPNHVVVSTWKADRVVNVTRADRKELWRAMEHVLEREYEEDPGDAVEALEELLSEYDALDQRRADLEDQLARKKERGKDRRAEKLERALEDIQKDFDELFEEEAEHRDLKLRHLPERDGAIDDREA